jgi:hypothetical protein
MTKPLCGYGVSEQGINTFSFPRDREVSVNCGVLELKGDIRKQLGISASFKG